MIIFFSLTFLFFFYIFIFFALFFLSFHFSYYYCYPFSFFCISLTGTECIYNRNLILNTTRSFIFESTKISPFNLDLFYQFECDFFLHITFKCYITYFFLYNIFIFFFNSKFLRFIIIFFFSSSSPSKKSFFFKIFLFFLY